MALLLILSDKVKLVKPGKEGGTEKTNQINGGKRRI